MTRGRRLLLALLQRTDGVTIGARCRVNFRRVSSWANGDRKPCAASRLALELNYGIPSAAWDVNWRNPLRR